VLIFLAGRADVTGPKRVLEWGRHPGAYPAASLGGGV